MFASLFTIQEAVFGINSWVEYLYPEVVCDTTASLKPCQFHPAGFSINDEGIFPIVILNIFFACQLLKSNTPRKCAIYTCLLIISLMVNFIVGWRAFWLAIVFSFFCIIFIFRRQIYFKSSILLVIFSVIISYSSVSILVHNTYLFNPSSKVIYGASNRYINILGGKALEQYHYFTIKSVYHSESFQTRIERQKAALNIIFASKLKQFLFGHGLKSSEQKIKEYFDNDKMTGDPHSTLFSVWNNYGFLTLLALTLPCLYKLWKIITSKNIEILDVCVCGLLIAFWIVALSRSHQLSMHLWCCSAVLLSVKQQNRDN